MFISLVTMESVFSLDYFSAIAADLHYVLLLGQPLPEFPCTAWHIYSQPAPSVPLVLSQHILLVSPASRMCFGCLRSIVKIEKSSLVISVSPEPSAYGPFLPDPCHVHLPLLFIPLPTFLDASNSILYLLPYFQMASFSTMTVISLEHMHYTLVYADPPKTSGPLVPFLSLFCLGSIPLFFPDLPHCCPIKLLGLCINDSFCCAVTQSFAYWCSLVISITLSLSHFWCIAQLMTHSLTNQSCHAAYSFLYSAAYSCSLCLLISTYPLLTDHLQTLYKALTNPLPILDKFCLSPSLFVL